MENAEIRLEKKGVKPTALRLLVFKVMERQISAVSLSDICDELDTVDKSTVFRTLTLFAAHHVVHAIEDGSGSLKYELCRNENACSPDDMHVHFHCEVCQQTFCLLQTHIPPIALPKGFQMESINYLVKGICAQCARKRHFA